MEITLEKARDLTKKYLQQQNNYLHSRESETILSALAEYFKEDVHTWAMAGLLHDLDWEQTLNSPEKHGLQTLEIIEKEGFELPQKIAHAISAHNEAYTGIKRESKLDYALAAGESVTGLIYAYALMRPEKLTGMKASSLNKKFKNKAFAANVSRELIADIEKIGLDKNQFFQISITALQKIADEIGL